MRKIQPKPLMVDPSRFAMVPRGDVPRSTFMTEHAHKTTINAALLYPIFVDEVLPGDVHQGSMSLFARVSNLLFPLMDNLTVETFFFFVPNRIVWDNWTKFMGEQTNPSDSIAYTIPQVVCPPGGFIVGGLADHFGLPVLTASQISVSSLPFRGYARIYNEWFRDQNLQDSIYSPTDNGPDNLAQYNLEARGKKHDYFTSALPWPLKGGVSVPLPVGGSALVRTSVAATVSGVQQAVRFTGIDGTAIPANFQVASSTSGAMGVAGALNSTGPDWYPNNLYADLSTATGNTINSMRLAVATQQFLEKDARGGTRYTELLKNHFGVSPEDARLQRPEYVGGGKSHVQTSAIPQTAPTGAGTTPLGSLAGQGTVSGQHKFSYHATEHGYIIGLIQVRADVTYQQGLHRSWTRQTRYDFYWPTFANLGEQIVRNDEIYCTGGAGDTSAFGYQERWAEYRYRPSVITGLFRSNASGNIDEWHLSQAFATLPALNATFIRDASVAVLSRALAAGGQANNLQVLVDTAFNVRCTRPMPTYSVPGLARF